MLGCVIDKPGYLRLHCSLLFHKTYAILSLNLAHFRHSSRVPSLPFFLSISLFIIVGRRGLRTVMGKKNEAWVVFKGWECGVYTDW